MNEMLELFDPNNINKSASAYNAEKLLWLNAHYIKNVTNERLAHELEFFDCHLHGHDKKEMILDLCKERAQTLVELKVSIKNILDMPTEYEAKGSKKFVKENTLDILKEYMDLLHSSKDTLHLACDYEILTKPFIEKNELKFPQLFQPIRIALTGGTQAPSVYDIMAILGFDEVKQRVDKAIQRNFDKE